MIGMKVVPTSGGWVLAVFIEANVPSEHLISERKEANV